MKAHTPPLSRMNILWRWASSQGLAKLDKGSSPPISAPGCFRVGRSDRWGGHVSLAQWQSERLLSAGTVVRFHREARFALVPFGAASPAGFRSPSKSPGHPDWRNRYTRLTQNEVPAGVQVRSLHRGPHQQPHCGTSIVPVVASWCARTGMLPGPLSPGRAGRVDPQRRVSTTSHPFFWR